MTDKEKEIEEVNIEETKQGEQDEACAEEETVDKEKELNDKYMRLFAEFDNFKKRTQKEKTQIYTIAAAEVVEAVLPFLDNLKRATSVAVECDEARQVLDGVKLIERQFEETLLNLGVEPIEAIGKEFNPEMHNAVMHVDDDAVDGANIVVEEFAKGYKYKEKVIRHSTVKVAN